MSDLTEVIEAAAALAEVAATAEDAIDIASQYAYGRTITTHGSVAAVEAAVAAAEPIIRADERAKVAEEIATDILARLAAIGLRPTPWADGYTLASRYAAAVSRKHAANGPQIDAAGREGACTSDSTQDGPNAAETLSGRSGEGSQT